MLRASCKGRVTIAMWGFEVARPVRTAGGKTTVSPWIIFWRISFDGVGMVVHQATTEYLID